LWCIDLNSTNITMQGSESVDCIEMRIGDRVEVGEFGIAFDRLSKLQPDAPLQAEDRSEGVAVAAASAARVAIPTDSAVDLDHNETLAPRRNAWRNPDSGILNEPFESSDTGSSAVSNPSPFDLQPSPMNGRTSDADSDTLAESGDLSDRVLTEASTQAERMVGERGVTSRPANRHSPDAGIQSPGTQGMGVSGAIAEGLAALIENLPCVRQLDELSYQLQAQLEQIRAETARLAEQSEHLTATRLLWERERLELRRLLAEASNHPALLGDAPARPRMAHTEVDPSSSCGQSSGGQSIAGQAPAISNLPPAPRDGQLLSVQAISVETLSSAPPASVAEPATAPGQATGDAPQPRAEATADGASNSAASNAVVPNTNVPNAVAANAASPITATREATGALPVDASASAAVPPRKQSARSSRRATVDRDRLVDFVSDRMVVLERRRRRKKSLVASGLGLGVVLLLAVSGCLWIQFGQDYVPVPPVVSQWLEAVANPAR
jgi:hypothetical protein